MELVSPRRGRCGWLGHFTARGSATVKTAHWPEQSKAPETQELAWLEASKSRIVLCMGHTLQEFGEGRDKGP